MNSTPSGPYRDGAIHVVSERCATCIYRPGNLMKLNPGRVKDMSDSALADGSAIICHSTLPQVAGEGAEAVCHGFYAAHSGDVLALRLAERTGHIEYDEPRHLPK